MEQDHGAVTSSFVIVQRLMTYVSLKQSNDTMRAIYVASVYTHVSELVMRDDECMRGSAMNAMAAAPGKQQQQCTHCFLRRAVDNGITI